MNVELLIADPSGNKAYLPIVEEGIEWTTERRSTPGKLSFKVVKDSIMLLLIVIGISAGS